MRSRREAEEKSVDGQAIVPQIVGRAPMVVGRVALFSAHTSHPY
jgi:hypothetical protein